MLTWLLFALEFPYYFQIILSISTYKHTPSNKPDEIFIGITLNMQINLDKNIFTIVSVSILCIALPPFI